MRIGPPSRDDAGFTLIELVVVLAILGMLLALLPDELSVAIPGQQLRAAAFQMADDLKDARTRAVVSCEPTSVLISLGDGKSIANGAKRFPRGTVLRLDGTAPGALSGGEDQIRFFPDGSASGGHITLSAGTRTYVISVDWLTGRVDVDG